MTGLRPGGSHEADSRGERRPLQTENSQGFVSKGTEERELLTKGVMYALWCVFERTAKEREQAAGK